MASRVRVHGFGGTGYGYTTFQYPPVTGYSLNQDSVIDSHSRVTVSEPLTTE